MTNALAIVGEIVQHFAGSDVVNHRADRHRDLEGVAFAPGAIAAFAVTSAFGLVLGVETEMEEGVVMLARDEDDVAAAAAVAAAGAAAGNELLAPERKNAVAAVAGLHVDSYFVDEHGIGARRETGASGSTRR